MTKQTHKEKVAALASGQAGRVAAMQLAWLGISDSTVHGWQAQGYLKRTLPRVFAVGHTAPSREAALWAAVLYAGPGAMLANGTAAHWRGLIDYAPGLIEVSTPRQKPSLEKVKVFGRRRCGEREFHRGLPVAPIPEMMVGLAATAGPRVVHRALGQLDFQRLLDTKSLLDACGSGKRGSKRLREAIDAYDPRRKHANGRLELDFLELCRKRGLPLPVLNTYVHDIKCDAYWPEQGLVVELDGELNHSSPAQRRRDRRNDLTLRGHGLTVLRYDWELVHERPDEVTRDVLTALERLVALRRASGPAAAA